MRLFKLTLVTLALLTSVALLLIAWAVISNRSGSVIVSRQTTYIVDPLTEQGLPDYAAWMLQRQRAKVPADHSPNGAIPFWRATWPADLSAADQRLLRAELGNEIAQGPGGFHGNIDQLLAGRIEKWLRETTAIDSPASSERIEQAADQWLLIAQSQPFTAAQIPPLATWIEENQPSYELLETAAQCHYFYCPTPELLGEHPAAMVELPLPLIAQIRTVHRCLIMRAYYLLGQKKYDQAWKSCMAAQLLAQKANQHSCLVEQLVELAMRGQFFQAVDAFCDDSDTPATILETMKQDLAQMQPVEMKTSIDSLERICFLDAIIRMAQGDGQDWQPAPIAAVPRFMINWNQVLTVGNRWYDQLAEAAGQEKWLARTRALQAFDQQVQQLSKLAQSDLLRSVASRDRRSEVLASVMLSQFLPAISSCYTAQDRSNTWLRLRYLAIELALYRKRHGDYPPTLDPLRTAGEKGLAVDIFYDQPFDYQPTPDGFLLYSRGPNGSDDQGNNHQLKILHGFPITEQNNSAVARVLQAEFSRPLEGDLTSFIPESADDFAIRLPTQEIQPLEILAGEGP